MNYLISGLTISTALLLGACGGSSGGSGSSDNNSDTSSIAGLWDLTEVDPEFGEDIFYLRILTDTKTIIYDYQQDEFDAGDNCYIIDSDVWTLTPIGGNQYLSEFVDFPEDTQTVTITRSGDVLTVSYTDDLDENENGNITEVLTFTYPLLTGVDPVFNECL